MKVLTTSIIAALALTTAQSYAGNGDLIVKGTASIGTTAPVSPLTIGTPVYPPFNPTLTGTQVNISEEPTATSGFVSTVHLVSKPIPATNSTAVHTLMSSELVVPDSSTTNFQTLSGLRSQIYNYGSGDVKWEVGSNGLVYNYSPSGTITNQYGASGGAYNTSTGLVTVQSGVRGITQNSGGGTVTTQLGLFGMANNYGVGSVTNSYGIYTYVSNSTTGTIGTAYGLAIGNPTTAAISNPSGVVTTGYGLYVGANQATNKWAIYSSDATAPSYFAGNVGIGTATPAFTLDVQGQVASNGVVLTSDAKFKKNLLSITNPLDKVLNLNGLSYEWKTDEYAEKNFPAGRHYGVIAQEIEKVLPEVVNTNSKGDKSVAYSEIIPVLIEAIKEQQKIIAKQQEELKEIRALILK